VIRRLLVITLWIIGGYGLAAALFWALLQVPESSAWALALSAGVALAIVVVALWVTGGVLLAWRPEIAPLRAFVSGLGRALAVMAGALLFVAIWWLTSTAIAWHDAHAGEIDASIIARTGQSNTAWLHRTIVWTIWILRWGPGLTLALSLAGWMAARGRSALGKADWVRAALHPKRWSIVLALAALFVMLPWRFVYWRPARVGVALEPWFVGSKLAVLILLAAVAWALMIKVVTPVETSDRPS
jgi:hypothetical protein